jgi:hypothetical protein
MGAALAAPHEVRDAKKRLWLVIGATSVHGRVLLVSISVHWISVGDVLLHRVAVQAQRGPALQRRRQRRLKWRLYLPQYTMPHNSMMTHSLTVTLMPRCVGV